MAEAKTRDGFYVAVPDRGVPPNLRVGEFWYPSVVAALEGDGVSVDAPAGALVLRYQDGRVVEGFLRAGCMLCERPDAPFTLALIAFCPGCLPPHLQGPPLLLSELSDLLGLVLRPISPEVWSPIRERFGLERAHLNAARLSEHLVCLSDPDRVQGWLQLHASNASLCVSLLSAMLASGSLLDEHRVAGVLLAREVKPFLVLLRSSPQLARLGASGLDPIEVFLELAG